MNPKQTDSPIFQFRVQDALLVYTYTRPRGVTDVDYQVEWSDNLGASSWSSSGVAQQVIADNGNNLTMQAVLAARATGSRFVRLKITGK